MRSLELKFGICPTGPYETKFLLCHNAVRMCGTDVTILHSPIIVRDVTRPVEASARNMAFVAGNCSFLMVSSKLLTGLSKQRLMSFADLVFSLAEGRMFLKERLGFRCFQLLSKNSCCLKQRWR
ncbi:hypothetical protein CEXT_790891 [Caerostris extrusa]|uniref:Uncharacterized protein n=1 Tax=Caerostris extrusa TaxID=172846 RepID=A0AAV4NIR9_CAEEX|nr:hypothetical protein CEXT_790891 [Caerostris extrusa]